MGKDAPVFTIRDITSRNAFWCDVIAAIDAPNWALACAAGVPMSPWTKGEFAGQLGGTRPRPRVDGGTGDSLNFLDTHSFFLV